MPLQHLAVLAFMPVTRQEVGQELGLLDRGGADEDRLAAQVALGDLLQDRGVLLGLGAINLVVVVFPHDRAVRRDFRHVHLINVAEFGSFRRSRPSHARELAIEAEVVLDRDRRQGLILGLNLDGFLGLDRLVKAFRKPAAVHHAARELVDEHDLVRLDDVIFIFGVNDVGA